MSEAGESEIGEVAAVRAGDALDWPALEAYLRLHVEDLPAAPMQVLQFPRGHANLTYRLSFGDLRLVLRRPPFGKTAPGAHDMGREHKILSRLWRAYPRAPRAYALCEDASVIGAPFVVQEYRADGVVIFQAPPEGMKGLPDLGERLTQALAAALADLHQVDFETVGLGDLGQADGFLERQLSGWRDRWRRAAAARPVADMEALVERLERERPASRRAAIVHNDFKLDNCQFRPDRPDEVVSVFDWDMATLGDPLVDVGVALDYWRYTRANPALDVPPKETLARLYAERSGIEVSDLVWYEAFAAWRSGVAIQQLYNRYAEGDSHDERMRKLEALVPAIAARGLSLLDEGA
jgi:aminoglycoside phosphotransferase (APT) family kinase protein